MSPHSRNCVSQRQVQSGPSWGERIGRPSNLQGYQISSEAIRSYGGVCKSILVKSDTWGGCGYSTIKLSPISHVSACRNLSFSAGFGNCAYGFGKTPSDVGIYIERPPAAVHAATNNFMGRPRSFRYLRVPRGSGFTVDKAQPGATTLCNLHLVFEAHVAFDHLV